MKTKTVKVIPYYTTAICPNCGKELKMSDMVLMTYPPQYSYSCEDCNYTETSSEQFPHLECKPIEE